MAAEAAVPTNRMFIDTPVKKEGPLKAWLVGIKRHGTTAEEAQEHLDELRELVATMGVPVAGDETANVNTATPQYLVGSGKVETIKANAIAHEADLIIIDDEMTPAQQRNWEKLTELAVIDRREVILDIFKQRAHTREARLQVELAKLEYSLPRLKRAWTHLERQRGGGGFTGGAGEAQIEVDRRIVKDDILKLKRELKEVRLARATQRKSRQGKPVPTVSLVGYTNAGKSSLLNVLTGADVLAEDKLFATLDPTTRRIQLSNNQELLLTDTVGFIRKLPTMLVEAFKATLEEAQLADMLLHVVDASHPNAEHHIAATNEVLAELDCIDTPTVYILNKADLVQDEVALARLRELAKPSIMTSTVTGLGIDELRRHLAQFAGKDLDRFHVRIPPDRYDLVSFLHREGHVLLEKYEDEFADLEVELPRKLHHKIAEFEVPLVVGR